MLWSTDGFPDIVNGRGSFIPTSFVNLASAAKNFPDKRSVAALRRYGVRSVTVHLRYARGTPLARNASQRSLRGLNLKRERRPGTLLFVLR